MPAMSTETDSERLNSDVAMLVDWENLKFSLAQRGQRPNVAALRSAAERFGRIVYARAYADWQDSAHRNDAAGLYMAGLEPVYVPTRRFPDESGGVRVKDSVDVKLTADCIEASHQFPDIRTFIIVSGDHGFLHVVNTLRPRGKQVVVVGVSWSTARQLTEPADVVLYYDLEVERPLSTAGSPPPPPTSPTRNVPPKVAEAASTVTNQLGGAEASMVDPAAVATALQEALAVLAEFRAAGRELSVSSLGQELQKRIPPATYATQVKGKLTTLIQALAAHKLIKTATRNLQECLYLPDELLPAPEPRPAAMPRLDITASMYTDLGADERARVIRAVRALQDDASLDFLTFKRIQSAVASALTRDEYGVYNLTNSMIQFNVLKVEGRRRGYSETGSIYEFDTFALDEAHPDVRNLH